MEYDSELESDSSGSGGVQGLNDDSFEEKNGMPRFEEIETKMNKPTLDPLHKSKNQKKSKQPVVEVKPAKADKKDKKSSKKEKKEEKSKPVVEVKPVKVEKK